jgi:hypothetical protein
MARKQYQYRALVRLSHRDDGREWQVGEIVDLSHATPDEIRTLRDGGAVERLDVTPPASRPTAQTSARQRDKDTEAAGG